jgi:hypothetical protein
MNQAVILTFGPSESEKLLGRLRSHKLCKFHPFVAAVVSADLSRSLFHELYRAAFLRAELDQAVSRNSHRGSI